MTADVKSEQSNQFIVDEQQPAEQRPEKLLCEEPLMKFLGRASVIFSARAKDANYCPPSLPPASRTAELTKQSPSTSAKWSKPDMLV